MPRHKESRVVISQFRVHLRQRTMLDASSHIAGTEEVEVVRLDAGEPAKAGLHPVAYLPCGQPRQHTHQQHRGSFPAKPRNVRQNQKQSNS